MMTDGYRAEMVRLLQGQRQRYPLMTEEDVVKFAFQGMLGVGHLAPSEAVVMERLHEEMSGLAPDGDEPLIERLSPDWFRLNLRAAMAGGIPEEEIARMVCQSARKLPQAFSRRDVVDFCVALDGSEAMRAAAEHVLEETWLPSHSGQYRAAYHPAYRVLFREFG